VHISRTLNVKSVLLSSNLNTGLIKSVLHNDFRPEEAISILQMF
jgi:hypothetical protein